MNYSFDDLASQPIPKPPKKSCSCCSSSASAAGPLGNTTILGAAQATRGFQDYRLNELGSVDKQTGEIVYLKSDGKGGFKKAFNRSDFRQKKYALQRVAADILPSSFQKDKTIANFRVKTCLQRRYSVNDTADGGKVGVLKDNDSGACHYNGLMVCGSVWTCPVCASKITERKASIVQQVIDRHMDKDANNGDVLLVTFTTPHTRNDSLKFLLDAFKKAERGFSKTRAVMQIKKELGFIEPIKSLEITFGHKNGWHPHSHQLWFVKKDVDLEVLTDRLYAHWRVYCLKHGLQEPSRLHGLNIVKGKNASEYITKMGWNISAEVTKSHTKSGKNGNFAPFDLLNEFSNTQETWAKKAFIEYSKATFGLQYVSRFPKLQQLYDVEDKTDQELAEESTEKATLIGFIEHALWLKILKYELRAIFLSICEDQSFDAAVTYAKNVAQNRDKRADFYKLNSSKILNSEPTSAV